MTTFLGSAAGARCFRYLAAVAAVQCGCTAAPPGSTPVPAARLLSYAATPPQTVTYEFTDTSGFHIRGGAIGEIRAAISGAGTAEARYAASGSDVELRMRITDFAGAFTNSAMGATTSATEADIQGQAVLRLTPRGVLRSTQMPTVSPAAQSVGIGVNFFRRFTLRLPAGPVQRGATWIDTVTTDEQNAGTRATVRDVVTATWAGDTTLAGRVLNVISHSTQRTLEIAGNNEGVQVAQKLTGTARGVTLWDPERHLVAHRTETTDLSGTFDLPAMGITGLPVTATASSRITLR